MTYVSKAFPALLTLMGFVLRYPYGLLGMNALLGKVSNIHRSAHSLFPIKSLVYISNAAEPNVRKHTAAPSRWATYQHLHQICSTPRGYGTAI